MTHFYKVLLPLVLFALLAGCGDTGRCAHQKEIEVLKSRIAEYEKPELPSLDQGFQHIVYFDIKDGLSKAERTEFEKILDTLPTIPGVTQFKSAQYKELGDERAISNYEYIVMMSFDSVEDYQNYQKHPLHIEVKEKAAQYLSGPPASYDFE